VVKGKVSYGAFLTSYLVQQRMRRQAAQSLLFGQKLNTVMAFQGCVHIENLRSVTHESFFGLVDARKNQGTPCMAVLLNNLRVSKVYTIPVLLFLLLPLCVDTIPSLIEQ